jgi:hypothetical protein
MKSQRGTQYQKRKRRKTMNGTIKRENYEQVETEIMNQYCNFSGYSMAAIAGGILLCVGIVIYAILTH